MEILTTQDEQAIEQANNLPQISNVKKLASSNFNIEV
jgi:hypothetical protein